MRSQRSSDSFSRKSCQDRSRGSSYGSWRKMRSRRTANARTPLILSLLGVLSASVAGAQTMSDAGPLPPISIVVGIGGGSRMGQLPAAYRADGPHVGVIAVFAVRGRFPIEGSLDYSTQSHQVRSASGGKSYDFQVGQLGVGPGFATRLGRRSTLSGSAQGSVLYAGWGRKVVGTCGPNCFLVSDEDLDTQNEISVGFGARLRADLRLAEGRDGGWLGLGIEARGLAARPHRQSQIPLSHFSIVVALILHFHYSTS